MAKEKTQLTAQEYIVALGLFTIARQNYERAKMAEKALGEHLGYKDGDVYLGCISDELYNLTCDFNAGLEHEGFVVPDLSDIKAAAILQDGP